MYNIYCGRFVERARARVDVDADAGGTAREVPIIKFNFHFTSRPDECTARFAEKTTSAPGAFVIFIACRPRLYADINVTIVDVRCTPLALRCDGNGAELAPGKHDCSSTPCRSYVCVCVRLDLPSHRVRLRHGQSDVALVCATNRKPHCDSHQRGN